VFAVMDIMIMVLAKSVFSATLYVKPAPHIQLAYLVIQLKIFISQTILAFV
jgi:hypothetical protein